MTCIIGIDPGLGGAVAALVAPESPAKIGDNIEVLGIWDNPVYQIGSGPQGANLGRSLPHVGNMIKLLGEIAGLAEGHRIAVGIEEQWERPGDARVRKSSVVRQYGIWEGIVATLGWRYFMFSPLAWQTLFMPSVKRRRTKTKTLSKLKAAEFLQWKFKNPKNIKITRHDQADALLIAVFTFVLLGGGAMTKPKS